MFKFKKSTLLSKKYEDKISDLFIYDEYIKSRKNIRLQKKTNDDYLHENCLFFICKDEHEFHYQVNNIEKTKSLIKDIKTYINITGNLNKNNIYVLDNITLSNYTTVSNNDLVISCITSINCITEINNDTIIKYDFNLDVKNLIKISKENSIIVSNIDDNLMETLYIKINNTYYLTNCLKFQFDQIESYIRECAFFNGNIYDNVWVTINSYMRSNENIFNHKIFSKTMFYECLEQNMFINPNMLYAKFLSRFLKPSEFKLQLLNGDMKINDVMLNKNMFYSEKEYYKCKNNLKKELLLYNFCTCSQMFENNYVFSDVYYNFVYDNKCEYEWNIIIPYHNRLENLEYLIENLTKNVLTHVKAMITVVEINEEITLNKYDLFNKINYIWINKKKLGGHFVKCLCGNFAHKLLYDHSYMYKYILWHDVDCITSKNFVNEINKKYDYSVIQTFHQKCILYANYELSCKIRKNEISVDNINPTIDGITTSNLGVYGGSILINVKLFEEIGMFNTSVFYDHSPEDNFILQLVKKYGKYCEVDFNNNYIIHLWHAINIIKNQ